MMLSPYLLSELSLIVNPMTRPRFALPGFLFPELLLQNQEI